VRAAALLIEIAVVVLIAYVVYGAVARLLRGRRLGMPTVRPGLPGGGRWRPRHYAEGGQTVVTVARMSPAGDVFEEHVVARIADSDDDWSRKFLAAKQEAEERAFHLNGDSDTFGS
jgi:pyridoxamine 5'-phosphate oxidase family protein